MSLRYKLFGIPGNLEEFADKAKSLGQQEADVFITTRGTVFVQGQCVRGAYFVHIESGELRYKCGKYAHNTAASNQKIIRTKYAALQEAVDAMLQLRTLDLDARLVGFSTENPFSKLREYESYLQDKKNREGLWIPD